VTKTAYVSSVVICGKQRYYSTWYERLLKTECTKWKINTLHS